MIRAAALALALLASACAHHGAGGADSAAATTPEAADETCPAGQFQNLVGARAADIDHDALPDPHRIITPDMMVTADFMAARLNIIVGTDGLVGSVRCF